MRITAWSLGVFFALVSFSVNAAILSVVGPSSNLGAQPMLITAPSDMLDDVITNTGMQGFDEAQRVTTTVDHVVDSGVIAAGSYVSSHMIFLNSLHSTIYQHDSVVWTFDGIILGIMSDMNGDMEAASTFELGASGTNYTLTFPGSGLGAPFYGRGFEVNDNSGLGPSDGYMLLAPNQLRVSMRGAEPGDWIRVVTEASPVPLPGAFWLFGAALSALGFRLRGSRR